LYLKFCVDAISETGVAGMELKIPKGLIVSFVSFLAIGFDLFFCESVWLTF